MKIWLIVAATLVVCGLFLFTVVMSMNHWDFTKLSTMTYVTNTHTIQDDFASITIDTTTAQISFIPSESNVCEVVCQELEKVQHNVTVEDGCLTVREKDQRKWYEYIGINIGTTKVTVTLPQQFYQSLVVKGSTGNVDLSHAVRFEQVDISVSTGNIHIENLSTDDLSLQVSTGNITVSRVGCDGILSVQTGTGRTQLTDISCESLSSTGSTGKITLENVNVARDLSILRSTGNVNLIQCDAEELTIITDTGNVTGSLMSDKVFITQTDTGRVNVPKSNIGGKCQVTTSTGNIKFEIVKA